MRKLLAGLAFTAAMWAGNASAAIIEYRFGLDGYFSVMNYDVDSGVTDHDYGKMFGAATFIIDSDDLAFQYGVPLGVDTLTQGSDVISAYREGGPYPQVTGAFSAVFQPGQRPTIGQFASGLIKATGTFDYVEQYHSFGRFELLGSVSSFSAKVIQDDGRRGLSFTYNPVPEPATWAMMIAGFGLIGATARRQRLATLSTTAFRL